MREGNLVVSFKHADTTLYKAVHTSVGITKLLAGTRSCLPLKLIFALHSRSFSINNVAEFCYQNVGNFYEMRDVSDPFV